MKRDGRPAFALSIVEVTQDEAENGIQFYLVEADHLQAGYEEPFVHFPLEESPPFLHSEVRKHLGLATTSINNNHLESEKSQCA
jgi:hypothetical protein